MRQWTAGLAGVAVGVLGLAGYRYATVPPPAVTHHHADWAVFIDGERLDLSAERFMEDVASCNATPGHLRPRDRVHLHDGNPDVVHVHHEAATWGHLMANLGMAVGESYLFTADGGRYVADGERTLKLFRDGRQVFDLSNEPIRSGDRVLLSFGPESPDEALEAQFPRVADNAEEYNLRSDPAACSGGHGPEGFGARLRRAFIG